MHFLLSYVKMLSICKFVTQFMEITIQGDWTVFFGPWKPAFVFIQAEPRLLLAILVSNLLSFYFLFLLFAIRQ